MVRIHSHGASGTIIATTDQKSYILSCAHMFFGRDDKVDPSRVSQSTLPSDGPARSPMLPKKARRAVRVHCRRRRP